MNYDKNNIFAKILRDEIACNKVYENEYALSFYDINPQKKLHILSILWETMCFNIQNNFSKWVCMGFFLYFKCFKYGTQVI